MRENLEEIKNEMWNRKLINESIINESIIRRESDENRQMGTGDFR